MEFAILGPTEVRVDGRRVALGGPKQRALLTLLLLRANEPVGREDLVDGIWGMAAPATASRSIDSYVSRLRALLGSDRIERRPAGYAIRVESDELDLKRFEALLDEGRVRLASGDAAAASGVVRQALGLWRGVPLADLPFANAESARLEEQRLVAFETLAEAELELNRGADIAGELERVVSDNPFRERLVGQLMTALYQAGRPSEALAAHQSARRRFADELGLDLSPSLRELEQQILNHDPRLGVGAPRPRGRRRRRSRRRLAVALVPAVVVAGGAAGALLVSFGGSTSSPLVELGGLADVPSAIAADGASVWIAQPNAGAVASVDKASRRVVQRLPVSGSPGALAVGGGAVWVASVPGGSVSRIDTKTGITTETIDLGGAQVSALAYRGGFVWVADSSDRTLIALDGVTGAARRTFELSVEPTAIAVGGRSIWVADYDAGVVTAIDARTGATTATVRVGNGPAALAFGEGAVWVANSLDSTVSKVDVARGMVAATVPVGSYPIALAVADGSVWVANEYSASVSRIDAERGAVVDTAAVDGHPTSLLSSDGRIWVGTRRVERHAGGTLRLLHTRPLSIDPAVNIDLGPFQSDGFTRDTLVTFNHAAGPQGLLLVPDLALTLPMPTDGGRTYTFRLRPSIRYSNGELLRAGDFRRGFERLFRLQTPPAAFLTGIRGSRACGPDRCDLSRSVVADEAARTVTIHLTAPDSSFLEKLTGPWTSPVPAGTPWHVVRSPIPGTGPYRIARATTREIRYVRNPYFREWSHAAQPAGNPDVIVMRFGLDAAREVREVASGRADWTADGVPAELVREVTTRFTSQLHATAGSETQFLQLNTTLPPFDDVRVRRALNYAIDRNLVVRLWGGPAVASATCQVLPPGVLGFRPYCPYTKRPRGDGRWSGPDLAAARRLVTASGNSGDEVVVWGSFDDFAVQRKVLPYVVSVLRRIGFRASSRVVPSSYFEHAGPGLFGRIQMTPPGWADSRAYGFLGVWLTCDAALNHRWFCDPALDRAIKVAQRLESTDPRAAAARWAALDREAVDRAAWVPLLNPRAIDFLSARVGNYQRHPVLGLIADQLTVR